MYYPKSQIKTNLYTNGQELVLVNNNQEYIGYYWVTVDGKYYTGKTPQDLPSYELMLFQNDINQSNTQQNVSNIRSISVYNQLKPVSNNILNLPTFFQPQPTTQDYQTGEFRRYFVKKTNDIIYTEVNKDTYDNILNRNPKWLWQDYLPFNLPWQITGDKLQVAKTNKNIVDLTIQRLTLTKFNLYLRDDYTKFYK